MTQVFQHVTNVTSCTGDIGVPDFCSGSVWCSAFIPGYLSSLLLYFSIHISGFRILQSHFPFCYSFWQSHLTYFHPFLSIDSKHGSFSLKRLPLSALRPLGREHVRWVALECKQSLLKPGSKGYRKRKKHATLVTDMIRNQTTLHNTAQQEQSCILSSQHKSETHAASFSAQVLECTCCSKSSVHEENVSLSDWKRRSVPSGRCRKI